MVPISIIAKPLANKKISKKIFKIVKESLYLYVMLFLLDAKNKLIRRGVKEVVKSIRKGKKGL
jgi:H/ACA ribonucleoprotein complex subunit 2